MNVRVGTSGFSYPKWRGSFYPDKLPEAKMLGHYAQKLSAVEINNSFYRMPSVEVIGRWAAETPPDFRFAIKSPRRITHEKKLADTSAAVTQLDAGVQALGDKLGPILFQLPPFLKKDLGRLDDFLASLPKRLRPALEFRHASWFSDDVYACLRARSAALCIAESEDLATPLVATAEWGYLRLRRQDYDRAALASWAERVSPQPWRDTFVFFKHEDEGKGPALAATFGRMLAGEPVAALD
jgi:uncharacterized protein YecE (DUF72 family)